MWHASYEEELSNHPFLTLQSRPNFESVMNSQVWWNRAIVGQNLFARAGKKTPFDAVGPPPAATARLLFTPEREQWPASPLKGVNLFVNPPRQERWSLTARRDEPNTGPLRSTTSFCWRFSKCQGRLNKSLSWRCCARARVRIPPPVRGEVCAANTHDCKCLEIPFARWSGCHVSIGGRLSVSPSPPYSASDP